MIEKQLLSAIFIFVIFVIYHTITQRKNKKRFRFATDAQGMQVIFKGQKYMCIRDNGRTLKLKGLRDMAWKLDCKPA